MNFPNISTQFRKGQSGNPKGRPRKLPELEKLLINVLDEKTMIQILEKLSQMAIDGNIRAAELLLNRAYGKPEERTTVSMEDERERLKELFKPVTDAAGDLPID